MSGVCPVIRPMPPPPRPDHIRSMSNDPKNSFAALSDALVKVVTAAAPHVAGVEWGGRSSISAIIWRPGVLVTSEQSLPDVEHYTAVLPGGARVPATVAGRDAATNVAVLRVETAAGAPLTLSEPAGVAALVVAVGSDGAGGPTAHMGGIEILGPAWESQRGGRIDRLIRIGVKLAFSDEGGPVLDAEGGVLGMSTFGPRRGVMIIPAATIERTIDPLLKQGRMARGWLGVGLHEVALPAEIAQRAAATGGLMVVSFAEAAPAAGVLLPGDIITAVAGNAVASVRALARLLGPDSVGRPLELTLVRGGALTNVVVTIGGRP